MTDGLGLSTIAFWVWTGIGALARTMRVASMSIGELAKATGSNKSAVVRVSKLSGYKGYRGLRVALIENRGVLRGVDLIGELPWPGVAGAENLLSLAREIVKTNIEVLQDTLALLDEGTLLRAVDSILCAKHVFLIGFGTSAPVVQEDAYQRFLKLQIPSSTCSDAHVLASIIVNMRSDSSASPIVALTAILLKRWKLPDDAKIPLSQ